MKFALQIGICILLTVIKEIFIPSQGHDRSSRAAVDGELISKYACISVYYIIL